MNRPYTVPQMQLHLRVAVGEIQADLESLGGNWDALEAEVKADGEKFDKIAAICKDAALSGNVSRLSYALDQIGAIAHAGLLGVEVDELEGVPA